MRLNVILTIAVIALTKLAFSQNSSIKGKVIDEKTGETLPGAIVIIEGTTTGANTDLDGNYTIGNVTPGKYRIVCKLISYNTRIIEGVNVKSGEPAYVNFTMQTASTELGVVEVVQEMSKASSNALLVMQKNSATVSDGISAESIRRTPDKSTSDVLKRVSGASIQDNKFVVVRGLNDRYNAAYINGAPLPSSEPDRKAFSFDIFPSNMLDNLVIVKTATPDLPGEFAGGLIQINTKSIPDKNFHSVSFGAGYNTITTGKSQLYYEGGKTDWIGLDDGSRGMPEAIPEQKDFPLNIHDQAKLAKETDVDWALHTKKFSPNYNFQYATGYTVPIKEKPLGVIISLTYNKTNNFNETIRRAYASTGTIASQLENDYLDKAYSEQVLAGALGNISLKANKNNSLSFKNLYSISSDDKVIQRTGETDPLDENPTLLKATARWFTNNKIYSGQLTGDHLLPSSGIRIGWVGALSQIERNIPNLRRSIYTRFDHFNDPSDPYLLDTVYSANIASSNVGPDYGGGMFFSENKEKIYSIKTDLSYGFDLGKELKNEIKLGGLYQKRDRNFFARQLGYTKYGVSGGSVSFDQSLLYLPENEIFSNANMGLISPGVGGFKLTDGTKYSDKYTASSSLAAAYLMLDNKYKAARLIWGARLESFSQQLNALRSLTDSIDINSSQLNVLPSANFILGLNEKQNVRLSYSQTLNRPEYRELAPFAFYDFNTTFVITGSDTLQRAKINNLDFRYELYPGRGQLVSGSLFYKDFTDPIEQVSRPSFVNEVSYKNVPKAINYGIELEFRVLIATLFNADSSRLLNNLTVFTNLAIIRSEVDVKDVVGAEGESRPLQGQSPYVLNAGLQYLDAELGLSFAASFNKVGPRIAIVGNVNEPDIWENTRSFMDLQVAKTLWKDRLEIKLNVKNLFAQDQDFYQNRDLYEHNPSSFRGLINSIATGDRENRKCFDKGEDDLIWSTKNGRVFSIGLSVKF